MAQPPKTYTLKPSPSPASTGEGAPAAQETVTPSSDPAPTFVQPGASAPAGGQAATPAARSKEYRQIEEATQYVPAPKPPTLLEILPAEYQTTHPPLIYRLSTVSDPARPDGRIAESRTYRAKTFSCGSFYKPISRTLVEWEDQ
jgi:hypothetical protein